MKEARVLLISLTPTCTELCRHLVLSGINVKLVDSAMVAEGDHENDFLINQQDVGRSKAELIAAKLAEMNPFATIEFAREFDRAAEGKFSAVVCGFSTW